jgi:hypothetical protein
MEDNKKMITVDQIDKDKVNNYLNELFFEPAIEENSSLWGVILGLMWQDSLKEGIDYDLAFACKFVLWKNSGVKTGGAVKQASISVGHLSISGLDSSSMGADTVGQAQAIYKTMLNDPASLFLQFGGEDCGCNY